MIIEQRQWTEESAWKTIVAAKFEKPPQLVLVFGGRKKVEKADAYKDIKSFYPSSDIIMCSTAGEILGITVTDNSIAVTAVYFEKTNLEFSQATLDDINNSYNVGALIASSITQKDLVHAMVFSDGLKVNGSQLVSGLTSALNDDVTVTGGLVGDGPDFKKTVVGLNQVPDQNRIVLVGFYGKSLKVGYGSMGGWDSFGDELIITKSKANVLFELDKQPALDLYKELLGDKAKELPSSGLLFPMNLKIKNNRGKVVDVVRTLLAVDEKKKSMTFAGNMPTGVRVQLMKANFDQLIDGAKGAAKMSGNNHELAVLISCVGRKFVLKEKVADEVEAVYNSFNKDILTTGFYSYGEICPVTVTERQCELHNQTMTITTFRET